MNSTYRMCNHIRSFMGLSSNLHRQFLTQSNRRNLLKNDCYANALWHNAVYKRFYCQTDNEEVKLESELDKRQEIYQKRLDNFLSIPENLKRFQILELEIDVMRHNADKVPSSLKPREWMVFLNLPSKSQRIKHLRFLWRNEKINMKLKEEKALKIAEWNAIKEQELSKVEEESSEMKYGLNYNSLFLRIYPTTINHFYNSQLMSAIMFEPKIVLDCGYENDMSYREVHNTAKQLQISFSINRMHSAPVHLYFCNLKESGSLEEYLLLNVPTFLDVDFPATVTSQSYLDLFPKEQLVYLTPDCRTEMTEYDPDMVYIIGAMVDKMNPHPLSLAKAKKENIRMAKLPLDKHLEWGSGSTKSLTINQMMKILLDLRYTKDWNVALQNVPTRKLKLAREHMEKKKLNRLLSSSKQSKTEKSFVKNFTFANRKNYFVP